MKKRTALTLAALAGGGLAARRLAQDETLALLAEGYDFIPERCRRNRSDIFETRLMLARVVCMVGEEAAEVFYEPDRFTRKGALP
jgi:fatty-acid peroxygenase